jgi:hypothetical protein
MQRFSRQPCDYYWSKGMIKYLVTAAAVAALSSAAPASAQVGGILQQGVQGLLGGSGSGIGSQIDALDRQIRLSFQRGDLSQSEAGRLQNELVQVRQLHQSYKLDGLSRAERYELQQRLERLHSRVQTARYDRDDRYGDHDGYDNDDDRYGRNGCPPGLANKQNGCLPPGQAKKQNDYGDRYGSNYGDRFENNDRFIYRRDGDRVLQIDRRTGQVVRVTRR